MRKAYTIWIVRYMRPYIHMLLHFIYADIESMNIAMANTFKGAMHHICYFYEAIQVLNNNIMFIHKYCLL